MASIYLSSWHARMVLFSVSRVMVSDIFELQGKIRPYGRMLVYRKAIWRSDAMLGEVNVTSPARAGPQARFRPISRTEAKGS